MISNFKKIKSLVEGVDDKEVQDAKSKLHSDKERHDLKNKLNPSGTQDDQLNDAPKDKHGNIITTDHPEFKSRDNVGMDDRLKDPDKHHQQVGTGVHGAEKRGGVMNTLHRVSGKIAAISQISKKGVPILPVRGGQYEDENGDIREFGKINTGMDNGDPYYFEFDHYDKDNRMNLVLYGNSHGNKHPSAHGRPVTLRVKAIVPQGPGDMSDDPTDPEQYKDDPDDHPDLETDEDETGMLGLSEHESRFDKIYQLMIGEGKKRTKIKKTGKQGKRNTYTRSGNKPGKPYKTIGKDASRATEWEKTDPGSRLRISHLMDHPEIKALLERYRLLAAIERRIKVGSAYGIFQKKDPGDSSSRWKLYRKINRSWFPPVIYDEEFPDEFDRVLAKHKGPVPEEQAARRLSLGAIGLFMNEHGLRDMGIKDMSVIVAEFLKFIAAPAEAEPEDDTADTPTPPEQEEPVEQPKPDPDKIQSGGNRIPGVIPATSSDSGDGGNGRPKAGPVGTNPRKPTGTKTPPGKNKSGGRPKAGPVGTNPRKPTGTKTVGGSKNPLSPSYKG